MTREADGSHNPDVPMHDFPAKPPAEVGPPWTQDDPTAPANEANEDRWHGFSPSGPRPDKGPRTFDQVHVHLWLHLPAEITEAATTWSTFAHSTYASDQAAARRDQAIAALVSFILKEAKSAE